MREALRCETAYDLSLRLIAMLKPCADKSIAAVTI